MLPPLPWKRRRTRSPFPRIHHPWRRTPSEVREVELLGTEAVVGGLRVEVADRKVQKAAFHYAEEQDHSDPDERERESERQERLPGHGGMLGFSREENRMKRTSRALALTGRLALPGRRRHRLLPPIERRAPGGDLLLPSRLTGLRESDARRERARGGVSGKGRRAERRCDDGRVAKGRRGARVQESRDRDPVLGRNACLAPGRP